MADLAKIQFKRTSTAGRVPTTAQVDKGELAINTVDGYLFTQSHDDGVINLSCPSVYDKDVTMKGVVKGEKPILGKTANYFDEADMRNLDYFGAFRPNNRDGLGELFLNIPHTGGKAHGRGISFKYGSQGNSADGSRMSTVGFNERGELAYNHKIYHAGDKPTPAELGVYSKSEIDTRLVRNVDFRTPTNVTGGYYRVASMTMPQGAFSAFIRIHGGKGYNQGSHSQAAFYELNIRAGNGNPKGITVTLYSPVASPLGAFIEPCWVNTGGDNYDIYVKSFQYVGFAAVQYGSTSGVNIVIHSNAVESPTKPEGAVDGQYVKLFNDWDTRGTLKFDDNTQAQYDIMSMSNAPDSSAKKYLRKFRNYNAGTIWHETVTSSAYTISTGSTDSNNVFTIGSDAIVHTGGLQLRSDARINGYVTLGSGMEIQGRITFKNKINQFQGVSGTGNADDLYSTQAGVWGYTSNIGKDSSQNLFPTVNNANGCLTFNTHNGDFGHQIGLSSNGRLYHRHWKSTGWNEIALIQNGSLSVSSLGVSGGAAFGSLDVSGATTLGSLTSKGAIRLKATDGSDGDVWVKNWGNSTAGRMRIIEWADSEGWWFYTQRESSRKVRMMINGDHDVVGISKAAQHKSTSSTLAFDGVTTIANGASNALVGGTIDGGSWTDWKTRASGLHINVGDSANKAYNIWKATHPGKFTFASMQVHCPGSTVDASILKLYSGDRQFEFKGTGEFVADKATIRGDTNVNGYLFVNGSELCVNKNGRRHISFSNGAGQKDFYIFKDVSGDGVHLNNGVAGGSEFIFKNEGDFHAPRNGNFNDVYIRSDGRLKINRASVENALEKISTLEVCTYDKLADLGSEDVVGREIGIIAQTLQKVAPEAVSEREDGMLTISNSGVSALIAKGIQELIQANKELRSEIESLKKRVSKW